MKKETERKEKNSDQLMTQKTSHRLTLFVSLVHKRKALKKKKLESI
jgi:hypothetical protein